MGPASEVFVMKQAEPVLLCLTVDPGHSSCLSYLHRCPSNSVVVGGRAEDSSHDSTHTGISLDLFGRLLALALEACLMAFEAGAGGRQGLAVDAVVRGIGALGQVNHNDTVVNVGRRSIRGISRSWSQG